jgi:hypothetical protein
MLTWQALRDAQPQQPQQGDQGGVIRSRGPRRSDERAELHPVEAQDLGLLGDVWPAYVLGGRAVEVAVDHREAVVPGDGREPPGRRGGRVASLLLHPAHVQLHVRPRHGEHGNPSVGVPVEVAAQIQCVGVAGAAGVARQEPRRGEMDVVERRQRLRDHEGRRFGHGTPPGVERQKDQRQPSRTHRPDLGETEKEPAF